MRKLRMQELLEEIRFFEEEINACYEQILVLDFSPYFAAKDAEACKAMIKKLHIKKVSNLAVLDQLVQRFEQHAS